MVTANFNEFTRQMRFLVATGAWVKYKSNKGQELVIGGYKPGKVGFDYLLAGYYEGKDLIFIGKIKNGFTPPLRRMVVVRFNSLKTQTSARLRTEPQSARRQKL